MQNRWFAAHAPAAVPMLVALVAIAGALAAARPARATPFAYVGHASDIRVVDTATDTIVGAPIPVAGSFSVAVSPDGSRVYVGGSSSLLRVIDTATNTATAAGSVPSSNPRAITVHPNGTRLYVGDGAFLRIFDTATMATVTSLPIANGGNTMAINAAGTRLYVPRGNASEIVVVDTTTNSVVTTITGMSFLFVTAITPSGTKLYAAGAAVVGSPIYVINTATNTIATTIPLTAGASGLAVNPAGTRLYALSAGSDRLHVIDTATDTVLANLLETDGCGSFSHGSAGTGSIAVNPAGTKAYFYASGGCPAGFHVRIFDLATNTFGAAIPGPNSGGGGHGLFIGPICPGACSDGNPCTTDSCNSIGGCSYTNNTGPCASDGNDCTDDVCDGAGACGHPPSTSGSSCDDGTFCNGDDTCDGTGGCTNNAGDPCSGGPECAQTCNEATDDCFDPATTACTSDGNVCTDDHCDGAGACVHTANMAPCDDGAFCNGVDVCAGTICTHAGDPCTVGAECANACNEADDDCFDPGGTPCTDDANPCTVDQCDGAGACGHPAGNAGATCRSPVGQCDAAEACTGASTACPPDANQPDGFPCTDGDACTNLDVCTVGTCTSGAAVVCPLCETCDAVGGCIQAPRSGCRQPINPLKASILLQDRTPDDLDQVKWKWSNGAATTFAELGNPLATDDYAFCVYDATPSLLLKMTAPAGGTCGTKPCWKQLGSSLVPKGYKYKDLDGLPHDLDLVTIKSGLAGKAKASLKGKGGNLPMPPLGSLALPLTTQLQGGNGVCFEATTTTPSVNTPALFKAKAD